MSKELIDFLENVSDESSFREFLAALLKDWELSRKQEKMNPSSPYSAAACGWENTDIGAFLDAALAWSEDSSDSVSDSNVWRRVAQIIYAGKVYE